MERNKLLRPIVYLMVFLFLTDALAQKFYWYYSIWWFDMLMHFWGGFWVGIFFIWFFSAVRLPFWRWPIQDLNRRTAWQAFLFVFFIGIVWEAGEFLTKNYIGLDPFNLLDTISDVFLDLAGGAAALFYCWRKTMPRDFYKVESN